MSNFSRLAIVIAISLFGILSCQNLDNQDLDEQLDCQCDYPPSIVPDRVMLSLTENPSNSQAISWRTSIEVETSYVEWAKASPAPDFRNDSKRIEAKKEVLETEVNIAHYHSAILEGLEANTAYAYRVGAGEQWSEWFHFTTAGQAGEPFSFLYFGDAQNEIKSMWSRTIRGAYKKTGNEVDFLLHAGDLVNRAQNDNEWGEWFYAGGWMYGMTPSLATPGNHEYYKSENDKRVLSGHWKPTFVLPLNGPEAYHESVYYVDYQGVRIISLDSQGVFADPETGQQQIDWLRGVLEQNPYPWTIVTHHHPVFSTKNGRDNKEWKEALLPIYEEFGVDLVLQGHDHTYGRGRNVAEGSNVRTPGGPVYVVSVSGPKMYDLSLDPWLERVASNTQLYQLIEVTAEAINYQAYDVTDQLYDAFEIRRNKRGKKKFVELAPKERAEEMDLPSRYLESFSEEEMEDYRKRFDAYKSRKK